MAYAMQPYDPTRVLGRRFLAFFVDLFLIMGVVMAILFPSVNDALQSKPAATYKCSSSLDSLGSDRKAVPSDSCFTWGDQVHYLTKSDSDRITARYWGLYIGISLLDWVVLQSLTGASVGKLLVGLRVIRADGQRAGPGWMVVRWFLLLVMLSFCFVIDLVMVFATKGHRRVGDKAAGTFVVRTRDVGTPPAIPGVTAPEPWGYGQAGWGTPPAGPGWGSPPGQGWAPPPGTDAPGAPPAGPPMYPPFPPPGADAPPSAPAPGADADGPIWDDARDTYIQYDRPRERWVEWDERTHEWKPIDQR